MMKISSIWVAAIAVLAGATTGCGGHSGGSAGAASPGAAATGAVKACGTPEGLIDDGEDQNNQTNPAGGRGGYWYTYLDDIGSTITPEAGAKGGTFSMTAGGAAGTKFAANMKGAIGKVDQPPKYLFGGEGLNFLDPKGPYDASKYKGITFWAKKGPGSTGKVRLKVPDTSTDPDGKKCTACFNDFGANLNLTEEWKQYTFLWSDLTQLAGWGSPHPDAVNPKEIYGMQFQVNQPGAKFDIWVDQVEFLCQ